jgi:hypothetical protein
VLARFGDYCSDEFDFIFWHAGWVWKMQEGEEVFGPDLEFVYVVHLEVQE